MRIGATWRLQIPDYERSVRGCDAALCQITLTICYILESMRVCVIGLRIWTARQLGLDTEFNEMLRYAPSKRRGLSQGIVVNIGWFGSRVVSVLDSGVVGPGFKSQSRRCRVTVSGKLFTPIVSLFTKQRNW